MASAERRYAASFPGPHPCSSHSPLRPRPELLRAHRAPPLRHTYLPRLRRPSGLHTLPWDAPGPNSLSIRCTYTDSVPHGPHPTRIARLSHSLFFSPSSAFACDGTGAGDPIARHPTGSQRYLISLASHTRLHYSARVFRPLRLTRASTRRATPGGGGDRRRAREHGTREAIDSEHSPCAAAGAMTSFTTRSPSLITRLHAICHTPQLTDPAGAEGNASHHVSGPNQPGGRKKTAALRYHHPITNCRPVVMIHSALLNLSENDVRVDDSSLSGWEWESTKRKRWR